MKLYEILNKDNLNKKFENEKGNIFDEVVKSPKVSAP